jgi:hypothetical protein
MARFKDFDAAEGERKGDPLIFKMGGREWTAAHIGAANFLAFSRQTAEGGVAAMTGFDDYITSTLPEDQREAFHTMLVEHDVQLATLIELMQWIVEQATGNPTVAASPSPAPQSNTGKPLVVYSRSPLQESTTETVPSATG